MKRILHFLLFLLFVTGGIETFAQKNVYLRTNTCGAFWNSEGNEKAMNAVLGAGNWQYRYFETVNVASLLTTDIDFLFIEGSNCGTEEMVEFLDANRTAIEAWVSNGGNLLVNAAPNEGPDAIFVGFEDVYLTWVGDGSFGELGSSANPGHPMFKGPLSPVGRTWSGGAFAHFQVFGTGLSEIIKDAESAEVYLAEREWGNGSIMIGGLTLAYFQEEFKLWAPIQEVSNIHKNLISYMARGRKNAGTTELPVREETKEETVAPAVTLGALASAALCRGAEANLAFSVTGAFEPANNFSVQLSDASGNFSSFTTIGSLAGTTGGEIKVTIPAALAAGNGYRIRVVASSPNLVSESQGLNVNLLPSIVAPAALKVNGTPGVCGATGVVLGLPIVSEGCVASVVHNAPAVFALGKTIVTWTVTDLAGNKATATQEVTVIGVIPEPAITVSSTNITLGYGPQQVQLTATNKTSAAGASTFSWLPVAGLSGSTGAKTTFEPTAAGVYTFSVTATNEFGCRAVATVTINVDDVRCGNKNDMVLVCHNGHEICISPNAVQAHLDHGCSVGSCSSQVAATATSKATSLEAVVTGLDAYPNPFNESTTIGITLKQAGSYRLELLDVKGSLVKQIATGEGQAGASYSHALNNGNLQAGIYIIRFISPGEVKTMKLIRRN